MENEIDLREIIQLLWRGRYIILGITVLAVILALAYILLFTGPVYQATVTIDPTPYGGADGSNMLSNIPSSQVILEAIQDLREDPAELVDNISLEPVEGTGLILVRATHPDPELCGDLANRAALALLSWEKENRIDQLTAQKKQLEEALDRLEKTIGELYGDQEERDLSKYIPYMDESLKGVFLELDPVYKGLLTQKSNLLVDYNNTVVKLEQFSSNPGYKPENLLYPGVPPELLPSNRLLKLVLAGLVGFLFSILVVFTWHYLVATGIAGEGKGEERSQSSS